MRVLGIDPGTATTGYGLVVTNPGSEDRPELVTCGVIRTRAAEAMPLRLAALHAALSALLAEWRPEAMAVEELFFARNVSTALAVGQARGVVLLVAGQAGLPLYEYKPREVKQALTGYGAADKRQVQDMLRLLLGLAAIPQPDDAADAVAVALCHLQSARLRAVGG